MTKAAIPDKYATEWKFASMVEYAWGDVLLGSFLEEKIAPARRLGTDAYLNGPQYPTAVARWLASALVGHRLPATCVDVGGGLGRVLVELLRHLPSLESATLAEPSPTLFHWNREMLTNGTTASRVPFVKGVAEVGWREASSGLRLDADLVRKIRLVHGSVEALGEHERRGELVTLLNVLDQCEDPSGLAAGVLELVAPGGYVCLADSYQYLQPVPFASLHELFSKTRWVRIAEAELPFECRTGERHRHLFLSHHVLYQKVA
jgi:hypothetical protein